MTIDFTGQVAIVTGAGGGLGRAHTRILASRGAPTSLSTTSAGPPTQLFRQHFQRPC